MELDEAPVSGPIGPMHDDLDADFWSGLNQGELRIQRCSDCKRWNWAPTWRCPDCGSWELNWEAVEPVGEVYSWIRTHQSFAPEFNAVTPYVSLMVALPHAGNVKLLGSLVGPETGLRCGAPLQGVIQLPSELNHHQAIMRWQLSK
jgi:uncharacterized OB-fold protein